MRLLILGGGFTGTAVARLALARGFAVTASTRSPARAAALQALGVTALLAEQLTLERLAPELEQQAHVLVTFPPDPATESLLAPRLTRAARLVYVSSTAVYGAASGRVTEESPVVPASPRAQARHLAERQWRDAGAIALRAPGIYGPGRGLHLRLARGTLRLSGAGDNTTSRIHVEDLAQLLLALLTGNARRSLYLAGDHEPAPHSEVVAWLSKRLGVPMPPRAAHDTPDESLLYDRKIDANCLLTELALSLKYPNYRVGYAQCLQEDADAIEQALRQLPGETATASVRN